MGILAWILFGLIAGALARLIMPGEQPGGILVTIGLGIVGALVGGFLGQLLGVGGVEGFNIGSFVLAIAGAIILLLIYRGVTGKKRT